MTDPNNLTPPPELVRDWYNNACKCADYGGDVVPFVATQAARWGNEQRLRACIEMLDINGCPDSYIEMLRANGCPGSYIEMLRATPRPIPVSERPWERDGWCDEEGRCWWTRGFIRQFPPVWWLVLIPQACTSGFMLPFHALPIPENADG